MSQPLSDPDAARIARRYPASRTPKGWWIPVAVALGGVLLVWTAWAGWTNAHPPAVGQVTAFRVVSDTQIDAQVTVQRIDPEVRVTCQVKALAITYDTVGELPFTWDSNGAELQTGWVSIRTFKRAVTADLEWCRVG